MADWMKRLRLRGGLASGAYWLTLLLSLELMLHILAYGTPGMDFIMVVGFSACIACGLALLLSFLPEKLRLPVEILLTVLLIVFYTSQIIYYLIFGTLYAAALVQQGGQAITNFWKETALTVWENLPWVLGAAATGLLFWPFWKLRGEAPTGWSCRGLLLAVAVTAQLLSLGAVKAEGTGYFTDYRCLNTFFFQYPYTSFISFLHHLQNQELYSLHHEHHHLQKELLHR